MQSALSICKQTAETSPTGAGYYEVSPDEMYPLAIAYIQALLRREGPIHRKLATFIEMAAQLAPDVWEVAQNPATDRTAERAIALDLARRVFQNLLLLEAGGPISLRILRGPSGKWAYPSVGW